MGRGGDGHQCGAAAATHGQPIHNHHLAEVAAIGQPNVREQVAVDVAITPGLARRPSFLIAERFGLK